MLVKCRGALKGSRGGLVVREEELDGIRCEAKAPIDVARPRDNNLGVLDDAPVGEVEVEADAGIEPIVARVVGRTGRPEEEECKGLRVLQVERNRRSAPDGGRVGGKKLPEGRPLVGALVDERRAVDAPLDAPPDRVARGVVVATIASAFGLRARKRAVRAFSPSPSSARVVTIPSGMRSSRMRRRSAARRSRAAAGASPLRPRRSRPPRRGAARRARSAVARDRAAASRNAQSARNSRRPMALSGRCAAASRRPSQPVARLWAAQQASEQVTHAHRGQQYLRGWRPHTSQVGVSS